MSIRTAGKKYNIPESTLRHKKSGYHPIAKKMGPETILTSAEEDVLVAYIKGSLRRATPVTLKNIIDAVGTILRTEREEGHERKVPWAFKEEPKRKWWRLFRSRHPEITYRTPETLTTNRKKISKAVIKQWFADAQTYFEDEGMLEALTDPSRHFNIDESGFSLSPKQGKVLAIVGEKHVFEESANQQKTNITVLANVCADGRLPPPLIIYPRKRITAHMAEHFPEQFECCVGKSDRGYITFETLYEYLCNSFNDWLNDNNVQRPIILWTDWHETRSNYFLAKELLELNIIMYGLPPNTTHIMQPLDVAVFGPLKKAWAKGAKDFEHKNPDSMITQTNFAEVLLPLYYGCIKPENIKAGFDKCGLYPFNPEAPDYSKLEAASAQREVPSTVFEGIECEGRVERSVQTEYEERMNRGTQTSRSNEGYTRACIDFLEKQGYGIVPPQENLKVISQTQCKLLSQDDMAVDYSARTLRRNLISVKVLPKGEDAPLLSAMVAPTPPKPSPTPSPSASQTTPQSRPSSSRPDTSRGDSVSPAFRSFNFYPERREGRGPKKVRDTLDRTFAISSAKAVEELKRKKDEREEKEAKKRARGRGRRGSTPRRSAAPQPQADTSSSDSDLDEPQEHPAAVESGASSDSMDVDLDDGGGVKVSFNNVSYVHLPTYTYLKLLQHSVEYDYISLRPISVIKLCVF